MTVGFETDQPSIGDATEGHPQRWAVLWILCGSLVLVVVSVSSLNVAIPTIQLALSATGSELQWIIDAYALVFAGLLLPAGAMGDRYGRQEALLAGLTIFGIASLGGMAAGTPLQLIIWRGVMGAAAALIMPATLSIIATVFNQHERPRAIAIWAGFAGAGGVVGLISSGVLLKFLSWGSIFVINLPIVAILFWAVWRVVPTSRDPDAMPFDPLGAVLSVLGLVALVYAIIEAPMIGWLSPRTVVTVSIAVAALLFFMVWEFRHRAPMLDPRYFTNRRFSLGAMTITVAFFGIFGMFFVLTQFFQFVQGHHALGAGLRILPYGVVLLFCTPLAAVLSQRYGDRIVMVAGLVTSAAGFAVLGLLEPKSGYSLVACGLILTAVGTGLLMPPATTTLLASVPPGKAGVGSAMNDVAREVGGAMGIAVVGALLSMGYRNALGTMPTVLDNADVSIAQDSLGGLLSVAVGLSQSEASQIIVTGQSAFTAGLTMAMLSASGLLVFCAVLVAVLHPTEISNA